MSPNILLVLPGMLIGTIAGLFLAALLLGICVRESIEQLKARK
jgi:hypothetical protein